MFGSAGLPEILVLGVLMVGGILWIWMLIEAATLEAPGSRDRLIWVLIIVFLHVIGAAIYLIVRRPVRKKTLGR